MEGVSTTGGPEPGPTPGPTPTPGPATQEVAEGEAAWGWCESYCSPVAPGTSVIEVRRKVTRENDAAAMERALKSDKLEVTTYADGFERKLFVEVALGAPPASAPSVPAGVTSAGVIPGLDTLRVQSVATRGSPAAADLRLAPLAGPGFDSLTVLVSDLQPGMNYYWRLSAGAGAPQPQQALVCRAAICPVDG